MHSRRSVVAPFLARLVRSPKAWLWVYALLLAAIAVWPTPVDQDAGPLLAFVRRIVPVLTYARVEFGANILLFVPFGVLLALILRQSRYLVLPIAFVTTVVIESVQGIVLALRTPSVLDIVANTAGACIGLLIVVGIEARRARRSR
ncbi:MAG: VanZ family protein [Microbacterium sp.]|uniref:VanZ family protein n=1 Tax=Microbacterium sp. TaxID=51671 RepID=UPI0039E4A7E6